MWLYLITWLFQVPVVGSMAEMASMAPTSAGQYHVRQSTKQTHIVQSVLTPLCLA